MSISATLIFDLDGTLIDSFDQISAISLRVRRHFKMKEITKEELESLIGLPAEKLFFDSSPLDLEKAVAVFREELNREVRKGNKVFAGADTLLKFLKFVGIDTAVATSKPHHLALLVVENSLLNGLIDHIQGVDGFAPKPNPEVIKRCQAKLPAKRFVMIGDRPEDIRAGLAAGCYCVGISQGSFDEKQLQEIGAHETFQSIEGMLIDIQDFLKRLENHA